MTQLNYLELQSYAKGKITDKLFTQFFDNIETLNFSGKHLTTNELAKEKIDKLSQGKVGKKSYYYDVLFWNDSGEDFRKKIARPLSNDFKEFLDKIDLKERRCREIFLSFALVGIEDEDEIKSRLEKLSKLPLYGLTEEKFKTRYGEKVGAKKWESYCNKQAKCGCSLDYFCSVYGKEEGAKKYVEVSKSKAVTLEKSIARHGEEAGTKLFNDYCKKQEVAGCKLEYFIEKYGKVEGEKEYKRVSRAKGRTLQNYIDKYGEVDGTERFKEIMLLTKQPYSRTSQDFFWKIFYSLDNEIKPHVYFQSLNKEYVIKYNRRFTRIDFFIENLNFGIEYYGNYFHANPKKYSSEHLFKNLSGQDIISASEIWEKDAERLNFISNARQGAEIKIVWESDANENLAFEIADEINKKYECRKL